MVNIHTRHEFHHLLTELKRTLDQEHESSDYRIYKEFCSDKQMELKGQKPCCAKTVQTPSSLSPILLGMS